MRRLRVDGVSVRGLDIKASSHTDIVGSICDRATVAAAMEGVVAVLHPATLHKPHVATHNRQQFVDTNITGTLNLLEEAVTQGVGRFVFTSTTSVFGHANRPAPGKPTAWITEAVEPRPRNIYGVSKLAAENLCQLFHRLYGLPCLILRTSRFFPEEDDSRVVRGAYADANAKANEFLYRRVEIEDAVDAHLLAMDRAADIGFGRYIISATTPFKPEDAVDLRRDAPAVLRRLMPEYEAEYARHGWRLFPELDRVYDNGLARRELGWRPKWDFAHILSRLLRGEEPRSDLAHAIGAKGYHDEVFADGPYPVDDVS